MAAMPAPQQDPSYHTHPLLPFQAEVIHMHNHPAQIQREVHGMDKRAAVARLHDLLPHLSKSFLDRRYLHIMALDPEGFNSLFTHSDPTFNKAHASLVRQGHEVAIGHADYWETSS